VNRKGCLLTGIALLLVGLLALGVFTITAGHFLATEDALSQADAIVVLGGDGGSFFRVQQGVELFNEGHAPLVVFRGRIHLCTLAPLHPCTIVPPPIPATMLAAGGRLRRAWWLWSTR